jgi:predicted amidohydrolase
VREFALKKSWITEDMRSAIVEIRGKTVHLLPEFELTDYPSESPLTVEEAQSRLREVPGHVVIAGFVERQGAKRFSSCLVLDGENAYIVRKSKPSKTEVGTIDASNEEPKALPLSIGRTVLILCSDLRLYCEAPSFLKMCRETNTTCGFLISAWKDNFKDALGIMQRLKTSLSWSYCYIMDRFHGLVEVGGKEEGDVPK